MPWPWTECHGRKPNALAKCRHVGVGVGAGAGVAVEVGVGSGVSVSGCWVGVGVTAYGRKCLALGRGRGWHWWLMGCCAGIVVRCGWLMGLGVGSWLGLALVGCRV